MLIKRRPGVLHEMAATWQQCDRRQAQWMYTPLLCSLWTPHTPSQQFPHPHNQSHLVPKPFGCSYFLSSCQATANATASCNRAKLSVDSSQQKSWHPQQQELQNQWQQSESAQSPRALMSPPPRFEADSSSSRIQRSCHRPQAGHLKDDPPTNLLNELATPLSRGALHLNLEYFCGYKDTDLSQYSIPTKYSTQCQCMIG